MRHASAIDFVRMAHRGGGHGNFRPWVSLQNNAFELAECKTQAAKARRKNDCFRPQSGPRPRLAFLSGACLKENRRRFPVGEVGYERRRA
jgi:hypothetical protein